MSSPTSTLCEVKVFGFLKKQVLQREFAGAFKNMQRTWNCGKLVGGFFSTTLDWGEVLGI